MARGTVAPQPVTYGAVAVVLSLTRGHVRQNDAWRRSPVSAGKNGHIPEAEQATTAANPWVNPKFPAKMGEAKGLNLSEQYDRYVAAGAIRAEAVPDYTMWPGAVVKGGLRVPSFMDAVKMGAAQGVLREITLGFLVASAADAPERKGGKAKGEGLDLAATLAQGA